MTFMIGGNDFCSDICYQTNATQWLNANQEANIIKTLRYMRNNMPRYCECFLCVFIAIINYIPSTLTFYSCRRTRVNIPMTAAHS